MKIALPLIALFLSTNLLGQSWIQKASLPTNVGIINAISFSVNDKLYVGGGYTGTKSVSTFFEYDPATCALPDL